MSDLNVSSLRFNPLLFDSTLNAHSNETDTDCNIDNVMTCDCSYFDSDTLMSISRKLIVIYRCTILMLVVSTNTLVTILPII